MYKLNFRQILKAKKYEVGIFLSFFLGSICAAQTTPPIAASLPIGASTKKVDEFLSTLRPPTSYKALLSGNDLSLQVPDIVSAGAIKTKVVSTIARTDGMWLLSMHAMPDSGSALFVGLQC